MKTAIITGASSGLGREFAVRLASAFPEIDEVWLIARRKERLEELAKEIPLPVRALALDLCNDADLTALENLLAEKIPEVALLINCAGCGFLGDISETDTERLTRMTNLNIRALTLVTRLCLPHIPAGGHIINISSIASFCPNPRMTVYSATKAYVSFFSLGLRDELRRQKISVTAVCPGPMTTEFLDIGGIAGNSDMFKKLPYCSPEKVVSGTYKAAKRNRASYTPRAFLKFYRFLSKIIPQTLLVKLVRT